MDLTQKKNGLPRSAQGAGGLLNDVEAWIASSHAGRVAAFQREAWRAWGTGESGLIYAPTGSGKTLAALGGPDDRSDRARRNGVSWGRRLRFESLRNFDLPIPSKARTFESSFA